MRRHLRYPFRRRPTLAEAARRLAWLAGLSALGLAIAGCRQQQPDPAESPPEPQTVVQSAG